MLRGKDRELWKQCSVLGIELSVDVEHPCTVEHVEERTVYAACGKPTRYSTAELTAEGWLTHYRCVEHLQQYINGKAK